MAAATRLMIAAMTRAGPSQSSRSSSQFLMTVPFVDGLPSVATDTKEHVALAVRPLRTADPSKLLLRGRISPSSRPVRDGETVCETVHVRSREGISVVHTAAGGPLSTEGLAGIRTREDFLARLRAAKLAAGISLTQVPGLSKAKVERLLKGTIDAERLTLFLTACRVSGPEHWQWAEAWARSTGTVMAPPAPGARRLEDWAPKLLGIHDAIDGRWPTYVPRQHDNELRENLSKAAASGGFVVLYGESCSGKTRSLYEAVSRELPGWWLVRPTRSEIADLASSPHTIVWLDEIHHLLDEPTGLELTSIVRLLDPSNPVVIVGTMPRGRFIDLTVPPGSEAASILEQAITMEIADQFTEAEQAEAEAVARQDQAVGEALGVPDLALRRPWPRRRN